MEIGGKSSKMISIVIPVYNVEEYLERCIKSILEQTYREFEAIFVNDGSEDNCKMILYKYAELDDRIVVVNQKNMGLSGARNTGIKHAKGEYVTFIDSDDWVSHNYLSILVDVLKKESPDIISVKSLVVHDEDKERNSTIINGYDVFNKKPADALFSGKISNFVWGKLIKREILDKFEPLFPVGRRYEDIATMYKIFDCADKVVQVNEMLYFYFQRKDSITGTKIIEDVTDRLFSIEEMAVYKMREKYDYWFFYRVMKCFGAMSALYKQVEIKACYRDELKRMIYKYSDEVINSARSGENVLDKLRFYLMKVHLADKVLFCIHKQYI